MPRVKDTSKKSSFLGLKIPMHISIFLDKDAEENYRAKGQHIISILSEYMNKKENGGWKAIADKSGKTIVKDGNKTTHDYTERLDEE